MAIRVARIYGGSPVLNVYEMDDTAMYTEGLNVKDFGAETSKEWARFVKNNRSRKFTDFADPECNSFHTQRAIRLLKKVNDL